MMRIELRETVCNKDEKLLSVSHLKREEGEGEGEYHYHEDFYALTTSDSDDSERKMEIAIWNQEILDPSKMRNIHITEKRITLYGENYPFKFQGRIIGTPTPELVYPIEGQVTASLFRGSLELSLRPLPEDKEKGWFFSEEEKDLVTFMTQEVIKVNKERLLHDTAVYRQYYLEKEGVIWSGAPGGGTLTVNLGVSTEIDKYLEKTFPEEILNLHRKRCLHYGGHGRPPYPPLRKLVNTTNFQLREWVENYPFPEKGLNEAVSLPHYSDNDLFCLIKYEASGASYEGKKYRRAYVFPRAAERHNDKDAVESALALLPQI